MEIYIITLTFRKIYTVQIISCTYYVVRKLTCISTQNILSIASHTIFLLSTAFCFCTLLLSLLSCAAGTDFCNFTSRLDDGELVTELTGDVALDKLVFARSDGDTIQMYTIYVVAH